MLVCQKESQNESFFVVGGAGRLGVETPVTAVKLASLQLPAEMPGSVPDCF